MWGNLDLQAWRSGCFILPKLGVGSRGPLVGSPYDQHCPFCNCDTPDTKADRIPMGCFEGSFALVGPPKSFTRAANQRGGGGIGIAEWIDQ